MGPVCDSGSIGDIEFQTDWNLDDSYSHPKVHGNNAVSSNSNWTTQREATKGLKQNVLYFLQVLFMKKNCCRYKISDQSSIKAEI